MDDWGRLGPKSNCMPMIDLSLSSYFTKAGLRPAARGIH